MIAPGQLLATSQSVRQPTNTLFSVPDRSNGFFLGKEQCKKEKQEDTEDVEQKVNQHQKWLREKLLMLGQHQQNGVDRLFHPKVSSSSFSDSSPVGTYLACSLVVGWLLTVHF